MSCHSVTVFLTLVQTKHKRNNTKDAVQTIQSSKYKYTNYQNTHTYTHPHITKYVTTNTVRETNTVLPGFEPGPSSP
jgi:predicted membrane-bound dolichyl-phosphate-mannose-protein mannosyltransferase